MLRLIEKGLLLGESKVLLSQIRGRRRTLTPAPWLAPKYDITKEFLEPENESILKEIISQDINRTPSLIKTTRTEIKTAPWTPDSRRVGLMATKIGMLPQWLNNGTRILCTVFHIQDNHVVSTTDPETWFKKSFVGKRKAFNRDGPMWKVTVGAINMNPHKLTAPYRRIFDTAGVPCKLKLGSFLVTEDAVVDAGTKLDVRHFNVGQYVTVTGKTIDWGFQGGMHRWGMRGMNANRTTKSHRRVGSIGSVGDARVWPGKRLPGHMGYEWRTTSGLQIVRINAAEQVMYVKGCVPGDVGEVLLIKDCLQAEKRTPDVPFPTLASIPEEDETEGGNALLDNLLGAKDVYADKIFKMSQPSIMFTSDHETKSAGRDRTKAKIAKVKK
uniref:39S ribosomal protein L3, mitochondrial n=1 Tax=Rhabditophanes sp. KR3021 TaxID=114890 RepID=A0AC35U1Y8_9BILA